MKKHFYRYVQPVATAAIGVLAASGSAFAEPLIDVSGLTPDMTAIGALGVAIITVNLGLFAYRKATKVTSKS